MAERSQLTVEKREKLGTAESRRLRSQGFVPANVYGMGKDSIAVSLKGDEIRSIVSAGEKIVEISVDGQPDTTLITEVQWDTFSLHIQHVDFQRVDPTKKVSVDVPIELRGIAPGVLAGGALEHQLHSASINCPVISLPSSLSVRINDLNIGDAITLESIELPDGAEFGLPADTVIVRVAEAVDVSDEDLEAEVGPAEPELIGRPAGEEEE